MEIKLNAMIFETKTTEAIAAFTLSDLQQIFIRDVDVFLDYLVKNPVPLSKNKNLPPIKWAQSLNSLLSKPEMLTLQRPMLPHYAQIMGLLLLVRSSSLASLQPDSRGNAELHINETLYQQWQGMNDIERYFSLLEAWINRGYAMSVGERISSMDDRFLPGFMMIFGDNDLWQGKAVNDPGFWLRRGKAFNMSILKMTGLAEFHLEDNNRKIHSLKLTPWGQLFLSTCRQGFMDSLKSGEYEDDDEQINLLPAIKAVRPDFQRTFEQPEPVIAASYVLSVALGNECTRTLKISANHLLDDLAEAILDAFDFDNDHLYHFQYLNEFGADRKIAHPAVDDCDGSTYKTRLSHLHPVSGMKITFVFDYGDYWEFNIVVMYGSEETTSEIMVTERKGEAPEQYPDYEDIY